MLARRTRGERLYLLVSAGLVGAYAVVAVLLVATKDFDDEGPLSLKQDPVEPAVAATIAPRCFSHAKVDDVKVVGGVVGTSQLYACYRFDSEGSLIDAKVIDRQGHPVTDSGLIKRGGAWRWVGTVTRTSDLFVAAAGLVAVLGVGWIYYRRPLPPPPVPPVRWWESPVTAFLLAVTPLAGWIALALLRIPRPRKARAALQAVFALAGLIVFSFLIVAATSGDTWGVATVSMIAVGLAWALLGGRLLLRPSAAAAPAAPTVSTVPAVSPPPLAVVPDRVPSSTAGAEPQRAGVARRSRERGDGKELPFSVEGSQDLPSFADVGGMDALKRELKDTFGLMLAFAGEARSYRLRWNGLLLHGPPGVGKTFIARATAGEFGLNFIHVTTGDVVSSYAGEAARNIRRAFTFAAANVPCILFFDEFDSIAQRRDDWPNQEARRTVNELLRVVEEWRKEPELIVMAATNDVEALDPAVIRPGRFDRQIRVDLPDAPARAAIFAAQLRGRPVDADVDFDELAQLGEGLTPAAIARAVEAASLAAFRETTTGRGVVRLSRAHLRSALAELGGTDRPTVEQWSWDKLVLPPGVKEELQQLVAMLRNPDLARALGVEPPTGVLLAGPPGTGKTTIAKVLAASAHCSFYPVTGADVTSMWLGESERSIARLFERARENRPSIIFFDEIDAIAGTRGEWGGYDRQINQLLAEIDGLAGQKGVLVVGATNRPDQLDPALLRGGRLSRRIDIPLPDLDNRNTLLRMLTAAMPLAGVDLEGLARQTEGLSGADLKALCQQAAVEALTRVTSEMGGPAGEQPAITAADVAKALATRVPSASTTRPPEDRRIGPYI